MPDKKKPSEATPDESVPLPKQPKKDYSTLPQKPITLKSRVDSPPVLKRAKKKAKPKSRATPNPVARPKPVNKKPPPSGNPWTLPGVSQEARDAAEAAAVQEGLKLSEWLEKLILQSIRSADAQSEVETKLAQSLKSIDERLDRIENQKGFWIRFWDRFMEQR